MSNQFGLNYPTLSNHNSEDFYNNDNFYDNSLQNSNFIQYSYKYHNANDSNFINNNYSNFTKQNNSNPKTPENDACLVYQHNNVSIHKISDDSRLIQP